MRISEEFLYFLAKLCYRKSTYHTAEIQEAVEDIEKYDRHRSDRISLIVSAANEYGIALRDQVVLDFGCGDGAITRNFLDEGVRTVIGVDIDASSIDRAQRQNKSDRVSFLQSSASAIPVENESINTIISYDVLEHVRYPKVIFDEFHRVLRCGGQALVGTWGWYHPFAPHLFATMPVPWAHCVFSEKTILRVCRKVYLAPWYVPAFYDFDEEGSRNENKYLEDEISLDYVNKYLIRDFEETLREGQLQYELFPKPIGRRSRSWTWPLVRMPWIREYMTGYLWIVLKKKDPAHK